MGASRHASACHSERTSGRCDDVALTRRGAHYLGPVSVRACAQPRSGIARAKACGHGIDDAPSRTTAGTTTCRIAIPSSRIWLCRAKSRRVGSSLFGSASDGLPPATLSRVVELIGDFARHRRGFPLPSVRPLLQERSQLALERRDEATRQLIALRRQGDHGRTPIAFVATSLDPPARDCPVDVMGHVGPVAAQNLCKTAYGRRLHRGTAVGRRCQRSRDPPGRAPAQHASSCRTGSCPG